MDRFRYICIMIGGFLGPFAAQALSVVLPEFAADFGITLQQASLTMTAYVLPFATTMLFSSYLVRNISPSPVVRIAYAVIAVASVVLVFTPTWWLFLIAYFIAGVSNAFTAPLLQIILKRITPDEKLGQALGTYAAMQSFGLFSAPLIAGLTSMISWRLMFVFLGVFALIIVIVQVPYVPPEKTPPSTQKRGLSWPVMRSMLTLLAIGSSVIGMSFIVALFVGERFNADPVLRGVIVMMGGLTAFIFARFLGRLADTYGPRPLLAGGLLVAAVAMLGVATAPWLIVVAILWGVAVLAAQGVQVSVNMLVLRAPGGSTYFSAVQAFRFFGNSLTPLVILPIYSSNPLAGFATAAGVLATMAVINAVGKLPEGVDKQG